MKCVPLKDDKWRVFLDTDEYRDLLEHAYEPPSRSRQQVQLEMRLMAESLRVDTVSGLTFGQFQKRETPEGERRVVVVSAKDSTEREAETRPRTVYIPDDTMEMVHDHADRRGLDDDDLLFSCSKRTIQRDVTRSAENAATATGNADFRKVSSHDLRRYFATHLLFRHEVPPPVVRALGGWKSDEAMFEYLVLPDDVLFERLGDAGLLGTSYDKLSRHDHAEKMTATANRLADLVEDAGNSDLEEAASEMELAFDAIDTISLDVGDDDEDTGTRSDNTRSEQVSFKRFERDTTGSAALSSATRLGKATYVAALLQVSWILSFGPIA